MCVSGWQREEEEGRWLSVVGCCCCCAKRGGEEGTQSEIYISTKTQCLVVIFNDRKGNTHLDLNVKRLGEAPNSKSQARPKCKPAMIRKV